MPVRASCPKCGEVYSLREDQFDKTLRCRECGHVFRPSAGREKGPPREPKAGVAPRARAEPDPPRIERPAPRDLPRHGPRPDGDDARKTALVWIVASVALGAVVLVTGVVFVVGVFSGSTPAPVTPAPVPGPLPPDGGLAAADPPPPPPGGPRALDDLPGQGLKVYNDPFVPGPDLALTPPQWFRDRDVTLPPFLRGQLKPNTQRGLLAPDSAFWADLERKVKAGPLRKSGLVLGRSGRLYLEDYPSKPGLLIGFFLATDGFLPYVHPIYLTRDGEEVGTAFGKPTDAVSVFKAPPGYAVGGMYVHAGDLLNGVALRYMRVTASGLDRNDWSHSGWLGKDGGGSGAVGHDGAFIVGVHGKLLDRDFISPRGALTTIGTVSVR